MHKELDGSYNRRGEDLMWGQTCVTIVVRVDTERLSVILKGQVIYYFHGYCNYCGEYGHQQRQCGAQHAHISTDEYERADDGYGYNPSSDYYDTYNQEGQAYNSNAYEYKEEEQPGIFNLMVRVLEPTEDKAMVTAFRSNLDMNLDSYCTMNCKIKCHVS